MVKRNLTLLISILMAILLSFPASVEVTTEETEEAVEQDEGDQIHEKDDVYYQLELFSTAMAYILRNYREDLTKKQLEKVMNGAIRGSLLGLGDKYSFYQSETRRRREQEDLFYAKFGGLGIRILPSPDGFVKIVQPLAGTPAMKVGLRSGDKIIKVNGESISHMSMEGVVNVLRGEVGTDVTITIFRQGRDMPFDVTITRGIISNPSIASIMMDDGIGYIEMSRFTAETGKELKRTIDELKDKDLRAVILDLRNNTGGMLSSAVAVSNAFLSSGDIVSTDGKLDRFDSLYKAQKEKMLCPMEMPLVILVNGHSASGSEIVAGAIKDHKRGLIVGETTFGKGVVQQRFPLDEYRAISITVSVYKTPNGTDINDKGIEPDIVVEQPNIFKEELLFSVGSEHQNDLDNENISVGLRQEFEEKGSPLSQNATVLVQKQGSEWRIDGIDNEKMYIIREEDGRLNIYEKVDDEMLSKLYKGEYVDSFVYDYIDKHPDQNIKEQRQGLEEKIPELMKTLADNEIKVSERIVRLYVTRKISSTKYIPNIDLVNDAQLAMAVEKIKEELAN